MKTRLRKKLFVNRELQGALILRTMAYWGACLFFVFMPIALLRTWHEPDRLIFQHLLDTLGEHFSILLCAAVLLPLAMYDMLKTSHRIAGPVFRLKREIGRLANGEDVAPLSFRPGDYWHDVAQEFNKLSARIKSHASDETQRNEILTKVDSLIKSEPAESVS